MRINHAGYDCNVVFARYGNGNTGIQLIGAAGTEEDTDFYEGEVIAVASVNGDEVVKQEDVVGIKTWSENEGIVESLVKGKVIQPELQWIEPTGFVAIEYYKLTGEALQALKEMKQNA